jgi:hypothetical protein
MKTINNYNSKFLINNSTFLKLFFLAIALNTFNSMNAQSVFVGWTVSDTRIETGSTGLILGKPSASELTSGKFHVGLYNSNKYGNLQIITNESRSVFLSTGSVGIGLNSTPTHKLQVNGQIRAQNALIGDKNGEFAFFGNAKQNESSADFKNYALIQSNGGTTFLNSCKNTALSLRIDNVDELVIADATSTFKNVLKVESPGGIYNPGGVHYLAGSTVLGSYSPVVGAVLTVDGRVYISENGGTERGFKNASLGNYQDYLLWVEKGIAATDVAVTKLVHWPDYVFNANYKLNTLNELDAFIKVNGHLPTMPSAKEVEENGFTITDMTKRTVKTIEELTLHIIEQQKLSVEQQKLVALQAKLIESLEKRIYTLESRL